MRGKGISVIMKSLAERKGNTKTHLATFDLAGVRHLERDFERRTMQPDRSRAALDIWRRLALGPRRLERSGGVVRVVHGAHVEVRVREVSIREPEAELESRLDVVLSRARQR